MTTEYQGVLVTKARINTQGIETIAHFKVSKISFQTTVLKVRFRDASPPISSTATHACLFQGKDTSFYQMRMWHLHLIQMPAECLCPLGFEEI